MLRVTPKKYINKILPDFPVGCKRRVFDPGYLECLERKNIDLDDGKISHIDEKGIVLKDGNRQDYDVTVYATGFSTQAFLAPMEIIGQGRRSLNEHWNENNGCQAYLGTTVSGLPNPSYSAPT